MRSLDLGHGIVVEPRMLRAVTSRSGGPGGQHVNKVETRVTIELDLDAVPLSAEQRSRVEEELGGRISRTGVLRVTSQAERSQAANRDRALARMEQLLRDALEEAAPRKPTRISRKQKEKRLEAKKRRSEIKQKRKYRDDL